MSHCAACYQRQVWCRRCKTPHCGCTYNQCKAPRRGPVTHVYISRKGPFGGTVHTTLCGRMALPSENRKDSETVNCKLCIKKRAGRGTDREGQ